MQCIISKELSKNRSHLQLSCPLCALNLKGVLQTKAFCLIWTKKHNNNKTHTMQQEQWRENIFESWLCIGWSGSCTRPKARKFSNVCGHRLCVNSLFRRQCSWPFVKHALFPSQQRVGTMVKHQFLTTVVCETCLEFWHKKWQTFRNGTVCQTGTVTQFVRNCRPFCWSSDVMARSTGPKFPVHPPMHAMETNLFCLQNDPCQLHFCLLNSFSLCLCNLIVSFATSTS